LHQLMQRHVAPEDIPDTVEELEEKLFDVLQRLGDKLRRQDGSARAVMVLDGLHLLDRDAPTGFLFETLPPGVFVVLLSQKCDLVDDLSARVRGPTAWINLPLPGLTPTEVADYLDRADVRLGKDERDEVGRRSNGLPLFLDRVVRTVRNGRPWTDVSA